MYLNRRTFTLTAAAAVIATCSLSGWAQKEGAQRTHAIVRVDGNQAVSASDIKLRVDGHDAAVTQWRALVQEKVPVEVVVALDDGMRDFGNNLDSVKKLVTSLPPNVSVAVGYMRNGRVMIQGGFMTNRDAAERAVRLPMGSAGVSGSPYFCISDISKSWPSNKRAARIVLMVTNGIDPYNGRPSPVNQNSPYVDTAISDAQRAGVTVYSIFWSSRAGGSGFGYGGFSGSNYLSDLSESTGGDLLSPGTLNPPSIDAFLDKFKEALQRSYLVTFDAPARGKGLQSLKVTTSAHGAKVHASKQVLPGN